MLKCVKKVTLANPLSLLLLRFSSFHAPDGSEEASNSPKDGRPELSESSHHRSHSVTNTVSHCCLDKRKNAGYRVHFNECIVSGGGGSKMYSAFSQNLCPHLTHFEVRHTLEFP